MKQKIRNTNKGKFIKILSAGLLLIGIGSIIGCTAIQKTAEKENTEDIAHVIFDTT